ncbi:glycosyltransferase [Portibacter marinus]|uniref:glycosyltransferase n=1 Tax=Portibacter marinus TaxID=2898660 RepID=UPI001F22B134|nr:glycosyltransferase [Portibacter marinus]
MKITFIGPAHPFRGGIAAYNERLARGLQNHGHEVKIYTFTVQYPNILFPGKTQYSSEPPPTDLDIHRLINSTLPFNWFKAGQQIKNERPDLVVMRYWLPFMGPCLGTIARIIKKNGHTKIITLLDNVIPHESRPGDKVFTQYFVKPVDAFIAMSKTVLKDITQFDTLKPKVLTPHPLYDNFGEKVSKQQALNKLKLSPDFQYILFFGFIRKYKGLDLLLEAMADPRLKNSNIKLLIAGEYYDHKDIYQDQIKRLAIEDQVIGFDEFIPDSDVKYFFNASDLVVQTYRSATQSGVTQIAYHFDKPMIVTDVGGLAEICPHEKVGYVVPVDVEAIADAIHRFFNDADQEKMIENVKKEKKKYSWDILIDKMMGLYHKIQS